MNSEKENIDDWMPYHVVFGKNAYSKEPPFSRNIEYYKRTWFCKETGNLHSNEKSVLNCIHCSKRYYKPKK